MNQQEAVSSLIKISREKCLTDFSFLIRTLNYMDTGEVHRSPVRELQLESHKRRLWLWHRGCFKTSIITEAHTIWLIIHNPDIRVLIVSNTLEIAKSMLKNILKKERYQ